MSSALPKHLRYVTAKRFSELSGYTEKAVTMKIYNGVWAEGIHYRKAPDHRVLIDLVAYESWVESGVTL